MQSKRAVSLLAVVVITLAASCAARKPQTPPTSESAAIALIATTPVDATLRTKDGELAVKGTLSLHVESSDDGARMQIRHLGMIFPDVRQRALTGKEPRSKRKADVLGVSLPTSGPRCAATDASRA